MVLFRSMQMEEERGNTKSGRVNEPWQILRFKNLHPIDKRNPLDSINEKIALDALHNFSMTLKANDGGSKSSTAGLSIEGHTSKLLAGVFVPPKRHLCRDFY